ncbi:SPOR domain-containing protein [Psychromonas hadalis]|uniref:SPOR domain-containing protein n=1 Tax=Psychromonas hadalis TaxID=211669 RepID=UPI0003B78199|nr:SPOR domain-containing protein [Psychromonas hadalis]
MASQFQNRLVGITILVASVVIFLPSIIDGKKEAYEDEFVATPIHPARKPHTQQLRVTDERVNESFDVTEQADIEEEQWQVEEIIKTVVLEQESKTEKPEPQVTNVEKSIPVVVNKKAAKKKVPERAWTIQLGAFQNAANINALLKTLHKAGFQAHTVPTEVIDGELTRLFVGPDISKVKLEKQLPRLKRLTKLQGKLLPFDAVNP